MPERWPDDATSDIKTIAERWAAWPTANIGVVTGTKSGIWVLDIDDKNGGSETLRHLVDTNGSLPETLTAITGAGRHLYFAYPGCPVKGSVQDIGPGVDVRGDGQYVVVPPSVHANGGTYRWLDSSTPIATAPHWLLSLVTSDTVDSPGKKGAVRTASSRNASLLCFPEGTRNNSLFLIACYLLSSGMARERVEVTMLLFNVVKCRPQLSTSEVKRLVQSASTYSEDDLADDGENLPEQTQTKKRRRKNKSRAPIFWHKNIPSQNLSDVRLAQLEDYQLGWRSRILDYAFAQGCVLPNDADQIHRLARPNSRKKFHQEWRTVLFDFEDIELDGHSYLYHPVLFAEYVDAAGQALVNKLNAEKRMMGVEKSVRPSAEKALVDDLAA
jgi:Bifunctional DNA primase/polymerase, N-terminal/Primase C terminal 1 (PriCT-1)